MKLVVAFPSIGFCRSEFTCSLVALTAKLAASGIATLPEQSVEFSLDMVKSTSIHANREALVERAIEKERTHLLFLDEDMSFDPRVLDIMAGRRQHIVCCNYLIKTDEPEFVAVTLGGKRLSLQDSDVGIVPIAYSGFGVSLFDLEVFKKTKQPWFLPEYIDGKYTTEDNPCYRKLRESGYNVYLDHDASKLVEHHGHKAWRWSEK